MFLCLSKDLDPKLTKMFLSVFKSFKILKGADYSFSFAYLGQHQHQERWLVKDVKVLPAP